MSTKRDFVREDALAVATELHDALAPLCERIEIVGSIRRMKRVVHDAELLYIPKIGRRRAFGELYAEEDFSLPDEQLEKWIKDGTIAKRPSKTGVASWGTENKFGIHTPSVLSVDFFATDESRWWVALVIRTGSKDTNRNLATGALARGRKLHAYGNGVTDRDGILIECKSEQEVFELCGVKYLEPWER